MNSSWLLFFLLLKFVHSPMSPNSGVFPPLYTFLQIPEHHPNSFSCTLLYLVLQAVKPFYCSSNYKKVTFRKPKHVLKNGVSPPPTPYVTKYSGMCVMCIQHHLPLCSDKFCEITINITAQGFNMERISKNSPGSTSSYNCNTQNF